MRRTFARGTHPFGRRRSCDRTHGTRIPDLPLGMRHAPCRNADQTCRSRPHRLPSAPRHGTALARADVLVAEGSERRRPRMYGCRGLRSISRSPRIAIREPAQRRCTRSQVEKARRSSRAIRIRHLSRYRCTGRSGLRSSARVVASDAIDSMSWRDSEAPRGVARGDSEVRRRGWRAAAARCLFDRYGRW